MGFNTHFHKSLLGRKMKSPEFIRHAPVTKMYILLFLNDRQGALDDCLSNQHTIKL